MNLSESQPVVIMGAGGHALVLIEILRRLNATILGATTIHSEEQESILGVPIICGDEYMIPPTMTRASTEPVRIRAFKKCHHDLAWRHSRFRSDFLSSEKY